MEPSFVIASKGRALIEIFVQPRAAKNGLVGVHGRALKVKVTALPTDDRANRAVETLVAQWLGVPRARVSVVAGRASRNKRIAVVGMSPESVVAALAAVLPSRAHERGQEAFEPQVENSQEDG
ncbi:MAG: DUF167 domain-containing protein [Actinomycetota bacterium]